MLCEAVLKHSGAWVKHMSACAHNDNCYSLTNTLRSSWEEHKFLYKM